MARRLEKLESQSGSHSLKGLLPPSSGHSPPHRVRSPKEMCPPRACTFLNRCWYQEPRHSLPKWLKATPRTCCDPCMCTNISSRWARGGCGQRLNLGAESTHICARPPQSTKRESRGGNKGPPPTPLFLQTKTSHLELHTCLITHKYLKMSASKAHL